MEIIGSPGETNRRGGRDHGATPAPPISIDVRSSGKHVQAQPDVAIKSRSRERRRSEMIYSFLRWTWLLGRLFFGGLHRISSAFRTR